MAKKGNWALPFTQREPVDNEEKQETSESEKLDEQPKDCVESEIKIEDKNEPLQTEQEDVSHGENH